MREEVQVPMHKLPASRRALKRGIFSEEEDDLILKIHSLLGNKYVISFPLLLQPIPLLTPTY
jgi:hypothetical protein